MLCRCSLKTRPPTPFPTKTPNLSYTKVLELPASPMSPQLRGHLCFCRPPSSLLTSESILLLGARPSLSLNPVCLDGAAPTSAPSRHQHVSLAWPSRVLTCHPPPKSPGLAKARHATQAGPIGVNLETSVGTISKDTFNSTQNF